MLSSSLVLVGAEDKEERFFLDDSCVMPLLEASAVAAAVRLRLDDPKRLDMVVLLVFNASRIYYLLLLLTKQQW